MEAEIGVVYNLLLNHLGPLRISFIGLAILLDFFSMALFLLRAIKGYGPSGIPVVSWIVYLFCIMYSSAGWRFDLIFMLCATVFHYVVEFIIPIEFRKWREQPTEP